MNSNRINLAIAIAIISLIVLGCTCGKGIDLSELADKANTATEKKDGPFGSSDDSMPDQAQIKSLVNETTGDFANAISDEDFSTLYSKSSPELQKSYSEEQFKNTFRDFTRQKRRFVPIFAKAIVSEPTYTKEPRFRTEQGQNILVVEGKYETKPLPVTFDYQYVKRDGKWKLLILKVYVR